MSTDALLAVLRERFGHDAFRPGQQRVIRSLLAERDALAVFPTGAGKSLVYQLTAQLLPSVTLVVSPLLALIKDQVDSLAELGLDARAISSLQSESAMDQAIEAAERGESKLLYVTPERFDDAEFTTQMQRIRVSLFVVDEAHSISEWGNSFRPAYLGLRAAAERLARPPILAMTATATQWVRDDIIDRLGMRNPEVVVRGTDRPNLFLEVIRVEEEHQDQSVLRELLVDLSHDVEPPMRAAMRGSGIIYTSTVRAAGETTTWPSDWGISAEQYHGQLKKADRERVQTAFMDGQVRVVVATNAFGLGVDKPDVRFVIHRDVPASLEAYYQEAGRAGRDGDLARCVLVYRPGDLGRAAFLAGTGRLTVEDVARGRDTLRALGGGTIGELQVASGLGRADVVRLVELLESDDIVSQRRGRVRLLKDDFDVAELSLAREERRRAYEPSRLDMMRGYAELRECRRRYMLNYFGEEPDWERCERCDIDVQRPANGPAQRDERVHPFALNDRVEHVTLGQGLVQRVAGDTVTVLFDDAGYKTMDVVLVAEQRLLRKLAR